MDLESFEVIPHTESIQAYKESQHFIQVASHHGWITGEEKDYSFARLDGYSVPSNRKMSNLSSGKEYATVVTGWDDGDGWLEVKASTDGDSTEQRNHSHSPSLLPNLLTNRYVSDGFSTTAGDSTKQRYNSYSHSLVQKNRDFADSFSTTDGDSTEQLSNSYSHSPVLRNRDFAYSFSTTDGDSTQPLNNSYSHSFVPRRRDFAGSSSTIDGDAPTTMMIRNIPNRYAQKDFIREFDKLGFQGTYNFLYLPMDKNTNASVGYCFVNFINHHWAAKCADVFRNYLLKKQKNGKGKYATVCAAHLQGLEANVEHYRNKGVIEGCGRLSGPLIIGSLASLFEF
jgi:hypothetical protein